MTDAIDRGLVRRAKGRLRALTSRLGGVWTDAETGEMISVIEWGVNPYGQQFDVRANYTPVRAIKLDDGVFLLASGEVAVFLHGLRGYYRFSFDTFVNDLDAGVGKKTEELHAARINRVAAKIIALP